MHGQIAKVFDQLGFGEKGLSHRRPERRLMDQRTQVVLIRQAQGFIVRVQPRYRQLQRAPGIKTGRTRIDIDHPLRLCSGFQQQRPFGLKELKVGRRHRLTYCEPASNLRTSSRSSGKSA